MSNNFIKGCKQVLALVGVFASAAFTVGAAAANAQSHLSKLSVVLAQRVDIPGDPDQVPTARYSRGESVDLSLIVEEWRGRYPATPVFACTCTTATCGDDSVWPYRTFTLYQPFLALGAVNAAKNEETGFNCFDMETGDRP